MKRLILVLISLLCCGCTITLRDSGTLWVEWGTRLEFGHNSTTTKAKSVATIDGKPLVEHIINLREKDEEINPDLIPIDDQLQSGELDK